MPRPQPVGSKPPGRPREYVERIATMLRLPSDLHGWFRGEASRRGVSINRLMIEALEEYRRRRQARRRS